jgi:hypothetical protein
MSHQQVFSYRKKGIFSRSLTAVALLLGPMYLQNLNGFYEVTPGVHQNFYLCLRKMENLF